MLISSRRQTDVLERREPFSDRVDTQILQETKAPQPLRERILMCAPDYFRVDYVINPWMASHVGKAVPSRAREQWTNL